MQPPPDPNIPIDPALALYPPYYNNYQHPPPHLPHHLTLQNYSSPSSQGSDTLGTPPTEHLYPASSNANGKRPASASANLNDGRKKPRKDDESKSPSADKEEAKPKPTRGSRACTVCRRLKMKCVGAEQGPPCKRCITGNHECIFEESNRGKRSSKKHEILTRSLRKMEQTLDTVLRSIGNPSIASGMISRSPSPSAQNTSTQALLADSPSPPPLSNNIKYPGSPKLHSLPDNSLNPLGLLAEASLANRRAQISTHNALVPKIASSNDTQTLGVASDNYFKPGPMTILPLRRLYIERQVQPEMLSFVTTDEVVALFNIYFEHLNMHCSLLDRAFHTPALICSRSPFLLTTICSIASKFYTTNPDLHPRLTELAKKLAFSVPAKGYKSVEIVQAYLLLSLWGCGAVERYEQDKTWLLLGMGIRMAMDLNLHRKTATTSSDTVEGRARDVEVHNRERTWILCFCLDRSFSAQMGKPHSIKEDYIIRHVNHWLRSPVAIPSDSSLAAYAALQQILSRSLDFLYSGTDTPSGLQTHCDYLLVTKSFESQLYDWRQTWLTSRTWEGEQSQAAEYKKLMSQFYFNYAMLVLNSFGLQNALEREPTDIGHFFARVHSSAMACALLVRDQLGSTGYMKYSPDSHFVQTSYAVLSLLKLVRPEFQAFLENEQKTLSLVKDVADVLENIAANGTHTPALYAAFLRALISAKLEPHSQVHNQYQNGDCSNGDMKNDDNSLKPGEGDMNTPNHNHNNNNSTSNNNNNVGYHQHNASFGDASNLFLNEFQFDSEMGPVVDISTFPPTMAPNPSGDDGTGGGSAASGNGSTGGMGMGGLMMENILSSGFWDSMLIPGYNSMDGLSGGFVFGAGGSGLITPRFGISPMHSGTSTPSKGISVSGGAGGGGSTNGGGGGHGSGIGRTLTQSTINAAFDKSRSGQGEGLGQSKQKEGKVES